jgi:hypothetical protein
MKLILSAACDEARTRPDGRLDLIGVFDELQAPGFPAAQDRMTVVFVMQWSPEERGRHEFRADLVDPDDRKVLTIEGHTDVGDGPDPTSRPRTRLVMPLERVVFPQAGEYRFILHVGEHPIPAFSLFVSEREE